MQTPEKLIAITLSALALTACSGADAELVVPMNLVDNQGNAKPVGQITIAESPYGLVFTPQLSGLPHGIHGFHVHENPDCGPKEKDGAMVAGLAAGGHYDPEKTNRHGTPWGDGHLGDLPAVAVDAGGSATQPVLAPRLKKMKDIRQRSLMIHAGGDNHADHPAPLGGGGARIACGVIQ